MSNNHLINPFKKTPLRMAGFTILELMIVIAISAIVLGIGLPSLMSSIQRSHVEDAASDIQAHLNWARQYALSTSSVLTVTPAANGCGWASVTVNKVALNGGAWTPPTASNVTCTMALAATTPATPSFYGDGHTDNPMTFTVKGGGLTITIANQTSGLVSITRQ